MCHRGIFGDLQEETECIKNPDKTGSTSFPVARRKSQTAPTEASPDHIYFAQMCCRFSCTRTPSWARRLSSASPQFSSVTHSSQRPVRSRSQMSHGQERRESVAMSSVSSLSERQISSSASSAERKQEIDFLIPQSSAQQSAGQNKQRRELLWQRQCENKPMCCVCFGSSLCTGVVDLTAAMPICYSKKGGRKKKFKKRFDLEWE